MALIKCPECRERVSDKADKCVHCGYPLYKNVKCKINGKQYDLSFCLSNSIQENTKARTIAKITGIHLMSAETLCKIISQTQEIPPNYPLEGSTRQSISQLQSTQPQKPKCPRCGSTSITAGQRGYSLLWGFLGSGNTVNRCSNCGNKWKP